MIKNLQILLEMEVTCRILNGNSISSTKYKLHKQAIKLCTALRINSANTGETFPPKPAAGE